MALHKINVEPPEQVRIEANLALNGVNWPIPYTRALWIALNTSSRRHNMTLTGKLRSSKNEGGREEEKKREA